MARNGSGVYAPPATDYPAVASTLIESAKYNNVVDDIATALTGSIAADGQTTITANLPMNSKKLTGLAAGATAGDSVRFEQLTKESIVGITTADSPQFAGINIGHASDTTITRASAGTIAVEGVNVLTTATGAALAGSVSQAFSVASLEVGNASDTTITRVSAGVAAIEGVNILTTATGAAIAGSSGQAFATAALTASGVVTVTAGSAAAPAITTSGDTNCGIFFPAADNIAYSFGGAELLRMNASGISTANSSAVVGGKIFNWYNSDTGAGSYSQLNLQTNAGSMVSQVGSIANGGVASFYASSSGGMVIYTTAATSLSLGTNNNTSHLVIDSTGNVTKNTATGLLGYGTGAGGTVTQTTSRTTGITINKPCGTITLVSAAGESFLSGSGIKTFTVSNSLVSATDVPKVVQKSGTDKYVICVTNVAAGSFAITFGTTGGTTTEQPEFSFSIEKAVAA